MYHGLDTLGCPQGYGFMAVRTLPYFCAFVGAVTGNFFNKFPRHPAIRAFTIIPIMIVERRHMKNKSDDKNDDDGEISYDWNMSILSDDIEKF